MTAAEDAADRARANRALLIDEIEQLAPSTVFRVRYPGGAYNVLIRLERGIALCDEPGPDGTIVMHDLVQPVAQAAKFGALDIETWPW